MAWPAIFAAPREAARDALLAALPRPAAEAPVLVVEIDRESLAALGAWPWPRLRLAEIIMRLAEAGAASVAIDLLLEGPDRNAPAVLAARLMEALSGEAAASVARLAPGLPDHDAALAGAMAALPVALGFLLAPESGPPPPGEGWAVLGDPALTGMPAAPGAVLPLPLLAEAASGFGALSLSGAPVREVPLAVGIAGETRGGLALEALRLALGSPTPVLHAPSGALALGDVAWLPDAGMALRLHPARADAPRVSAAALLAGTVPAAAIRGRVVLVGGAAPELGGLRATAFEALVPSVRLHAMAVAQLAQGWLPREPSWARPAEAGFSALLGMAGAAMAALLPPLLAAAGIALLAMLPVAIAALALDHALLLDPVPALAALAAGATVAGLAAFAALRLARARLTARFAQHLAPQVVARIAESPALLRIAGERRAMSFVFTDIEGFTALVERLPPERLVALLDAYVAEAGEIAVAHGGVIDKVVGDALHLMFGAPLAQPDHARRALECGVALAGFGARFALGAEARAVGFGRTRIGVASGEAVVGDVGGGRKLDYTAHGTPVNLAARLEAANKITGTALLADAASAAASGMVLRRVGLLALRGLAEPVAAFTTRDGVAGWEVVEQALDAGDAARAVAALRAVVAAHPEDALASFHLRRAEAGEAHWRIEGG